MGKRSDAHSKFVPARCPASTGRSASAGAGSPGQNRRPVPSYLHPLRKERGIYAKRRCCLSCYLRCMTQCGTILPYRNQQQVKPWILRNSLVGVHSRKAIRDESPVLKKTLLATGLAREQGEQFFRKAYEMAMGGNVAMMKFLLDRILPKERPIHGFRSASDSNWSSRTDRGSVAKAISAALCEKFNYIVVAVRLMSGAHPNQFRSKRFSSSSPMLRPIRAGSTWTVPGSPSDCPLRQRQPE